MTQTLSLALQNVSKAAEQANQSAKTLEALGTLLKQASAGTASLDVETLARLLLTLGLCIVHRDVVIQALDVVKQTEDVDGLSCEGLKQLETKLALARDGIAQEGAA
ncbi:MAG: hypothetical protein KKD97_16005 [Gammaproteobacteria bacterium]|nr:hypothetical protein [Gammaproteobacteria bacterium]